MDKKEDRRVRKTKKALREGMIELLNEKSIQNITVKELTDKADIHRSTFYANFGDVYELYSHMEDTIIQEISEIASIDCTFMSQVFYSGLLDYINSNKQVCRLFFSGNTSTIFFERLTSLFKNSCIDGWRKEYNVADTSKEMEYHIQFCLSGGIGVIGMWVSGDFEYPMEELVTMLANIDSNVGKLFAGKLL